MLNDILLLALNAVSKYLNLIEIWIKKFYLDLSQVSIVVPILFMALSLVILFLPPTILSKIIFLPFKIITIFLRHIGVIHDNRTWGVVYDSVTKEPVDPAYITIRGGLGQVFSTAITDLDGRFALILPPGIYTLGVEKTNYIFPSQKLLDKKTDGYFTGLYFGDKFEVIGGERAVAFAIPIDPADSDWNQKEKRRRHTPAHILKEYRSAAYAYFVLAGLFIIPHYLILKEQTSLELLQLYAAALAIIFIYSFMKSGSYYHSVVLEKDTGRPLSFARIKVFRNKIQVATKYTSLNGQFTCVLQNGSYHITIEKRNDVGEYSLVHTSEVFRVFDGAISKRFVI